MRLSVVIPAFNEEKYIGQYLISLEKQDTKIPFEVIAVNNNSADATKQVALSYQSRLNIRVITEKRKGRGQARKTGFETAKGDLLLSTDADTILPKTG